MPLTPVQTAFADNPPDPAARWDGLYRAGCHPWDRAGPSLALADVLAQRGDLVPAPHDPPEQPSMALVPGCGRGHDARLLARLGYDVWALDVSQTAIDLAKSLEDESKSETGTEARPAGQIHYLVADFFDKSWSGDRTFDLIFDYTVRPLTLHHCLINTSPWEHG